MGRVTAKERRKECVDKGNHRAASRILATKHKALPSGPFSSAGRFNTTVHASLPQR